MSAPECAAPKRRSNGGSMAVTGFISAASTCHSGPVRKQRDPQVLPAYGLRASRIAN